MHVLILTCYLIKTTFLPCVKFVPAALWGDTVRSYHLKLIIHPISEDVYACPPEELAPQGRGALGAKAGRARSQASPEGPSGTQREDHGVSVSELSE